MCQTATNSTEQLIYLIISLACTPVPFERNSGCLGRQGWNGCRHTISYPLNRHADPHTDAIRTHRHTRKPDTHTHTHTHREIHSEMHTHRKSPPDAPLSSTALYSCSPYCQQCSLQPPTLPLRYSEEPACRVRPQRPRRLSAGCFSECAGCVFHVRVRIYDPTCTHTHRY